MCKTTKNHVAPFSLTMIAISCLLTTAQAADEFSINNRTEIVHHAVSGPGAANSFLDPGTHILHETDLRRSGAAFDSQWNSLFNGTIRYTDSRQFDPESGSIQKLEWRISDAHTQINVGDYFANLSPYAMSKGIKGFALQRNLSDDQNYVRAFYGSFDNEWAFLLKDLTRAPMSTVGGGVRFQQASDKFRFGVNLAEVHDQKDAAQATYPAKSQVLPAVDWEYRESGLVVSGEHAYSDTDEVAAAGATTTNKSGSAHKFVARAALNVINLDGHLERVTPNFISQAGGATPDRLRYYAKADYKLTRDWRLFAIVDDYRDNLDSQKTATTEVTTYEAGFRQARAFGRRYLNVALSWRNKHMLLTDGSSDVTTDRIKLKLNDRVGDAYDWRAEIEQILDNDRVKSANATSTLFDLGLGYRRRLTSGWDVRADLSAGRQENDTVTTTGTDVTNRYRVNLSVDRGNGTVFGAGIENSSSDLATALADNQHKRASAYWQSKPAWIKDGSMKVEYADFIHAFTENAANDYREKVLKLMLQWNL